MVSLDEAVVARLGRHGKDFEILVDPDGAEGLKDGAGAQEVLDIMAVEQVFTDARAAERASSEELQEAFGSTDTAQVAARILREGDIQLTQEQRKRMQSSKHRRIVDAIARNAWNPQTKTPHPKERIERALEEAKFRADPLRRTEEQVQDAMKRIRPLLPIAFERIRVAVKVPTEHTGAAYGHIRNLGELRQEEWQADGTLVIVLEIPAGAQGEVYDQLNRLTQGSAETRVLA